MDIVNKSVIFRKGTLQIPVETVIIMALALSLPKDQMRDLVEKGAFVAGPDNIIREQLGLDLTPDVDEDDIEVEG